jgi:hypothetical protein
LTNTKIDRRAILAADPRSLNELLDFFEAYVFTIRAQILKGHDMLRDEIGAREHVALGHIFGVACDAEDLTNRLRQIRSERNADTDVTISINREDAIFFLDTASELPVILHEAADAMDFVHVAESSGCMKGMENEASSILSLCARGIRSYVATGCGALGHMEIAMRRAERPKREEAA